MIPTRYKSKLPKTLSWPIGAEAISGHLDGLPHSSELDLCFSFSSRASDLKIVEGGLSSYPILRAKYQPAFKANYGYSVIRVSWELTVMALPRSTRAIVRALLDESGLPAVAEWLKSSGLPGWEDHQHVLTLDFDPVESTLSQRFTDGP